MSKPAYQEAFEELQQIVADIEDGQISVDELSEKVSRASALIKICKAKLTSTEEDVQKVLASLEESEAENDPAADDEDSLDADQSENLPF